MFLIKLVMNQCQNVPIATQTRHTISTHFSGYAAQFSSFRSLLLIVQLVIGIDVSCVRNIRLFTDSPLAHF